jgi:hypothetical protein
MFKHCWSTVSACLIKNIKKLGSNIADQLFLLFLIKKIKILIKEAKIKFAIFLYIDDKFTFVQYCMYINVSSSHKQ